MSLSHGKYSVQQASDITGLSKQVIRKWEERYQLIQPFRLDNGYRIYSEKDINVLLQVKSLSEQGYPIKQAALMIKEGAELTDFSRGRTETKKCYTDFNPYVIQLLEKGSHCNEIGLTSVLHQAYHDYGLSRLLDDVVVPFLLEVGNRWNAAVWDEYQESVSSLVVRDFLVQIRRNFNYIERPSLVIGACLPNEQHEIPVHIILLQMMMKGWKTMLIGASPAPGSIESIVRKLQPSKVLLSATTNTPFERDPQLIDKLEQFASENKAIEFYLGGKGAIEYTKNFSLKYLVVTDSLEDVIRGTEN